MKEKKPFVANKNHFYVFIGLFLCLFSVILVLNTGIVARVLSTPFTFLFGSLSYFLYIAINVLGLRLIFAKKGIKVRFNSYFLASLILFISISMFFAHFASSLSLNKQYIAFTAAAGSADKLSTINFFEAYKKVFDGIEGGYLWTPSLMLFSHPFASGIIGYFLVGAFNALFGIHNGGLIFAIVIAVIALFIYFLPLILKLMGQSKEKKVAKV